MTTNAEEQDHGEEAAPGDDVPAEASGEKPLTLGPYTQHDEDTEESSTAGGDERGDGDDEGIADVVEDLPPLSRLPQLDTRSAPPASRSTVGTPLPFQNAEIAAEVAEDGPPEWLGQRWREMTNEDQQKAWIGLRRWVDWLIEEHQVTETVIPACWFRHSNMVAELYAGMNMEQKVWEEGAPTVQPMMMWLPNLEQMKARLRAMVEETPACGKGAHVEPEPMVRGYDEDLWRTTVYTYTETQSFQRPGHGEEHRFIRAHAFNNTGEQLGTTGIKALRPRVGSDATNLILEMEKTTGVEDSNLRVTVEGCDEAAEILWEDATTAEGPWRHLDLDEGS